MSIELRLSMRGVKDTFAQWTRGYDHNDLVLLGYQVSKLPFRLQAAWARKMLDRRRDKRCGKKWLERIVMVIGAISKDPIHQGEILGHICHQRELLGSVVMVLSLYYCKRAEILVGVNIARHERGLRAFTPNEVLSTHLLMDDRQLEKIAYHHDEKYCAIVR